MTVWRDLYTALYDEPLFGKAAVLTVAEGHPPVSLTVIDRTAGMVVSDERSIAFASNVEVQTVLPAALVRMEELAEHEIEAADVDGGTLALNGKVWRIEAHRPKPSPDGESTGELVLILVENP